MKEKSMVSDKIFKITVIALLILILGAAFGTLSSLYVPEHEEFLDFEDEFLFLEGDHHSFNLYTTNEYEKITNKKFDTRELILSYAEENGFVIGVDEEDFIEIFAEEECKEEESGRFLCFEKIISFYLEENTVEVSSTGFREEDE